MRRALLLLAACTMLDTFTAAADRPNSGFGPSNPFYAESSLPFHAPPFDKIKDADYQPAIEAGMAQQLAEVRAVAANTAAPTFENTFVPLEKSGRLLDRAMQAFNGVTGANTNPNLQEAKTALAPKLAAHQDAIYLNAKLFARVSAIYEKRDTAASMRNQKRLIEVTYDEFVHAGANLSAAGQRAAQEDECEESPLSPIPSGRSCSPPTPRERTPPPRPMRSRASARRSSLRRLQAAQGRTSTGYVVPLQNTTQQPLLGSLTTRATRQHDFRQFLEPHGARRCKRHALHRVAARAAARAARALLGFPNHAAWKLEDQMAKTPENAARLPEHARAPGHRPRRRARRKDIQAVIDAQHGGFTLEAWDWDFYAEQVRKAKYDLDDAQVKPYFELDNVLENGVFYAANQLYGITFKERNDIPVYQPDVRVFEVFDADGKPLGALLLRLLQARQQAGRRVDVDLRRASRSCSAHEPVIYNVAQPPKPAPGQPALISFDDVIDDVPRVRPRAARDVRRHRIPELSGTATARDFVEFPSQFNEHWATLSGDLRALRAPLQDRRADAAGAASTRSSGAQNFNQGYDMTELLAAAELDMQWHMLPARCPCRIRMPSRSRRSTKAHRRSRAPCRRAIARAISSISGRAAIRPATTRISGREMLADDAFQWFEENGGLTRANGDRFRQMILSRGQHRGPRGAVRRLARTRAQGRRDAEGPRLGVEP